MRWTRRIWTRCRAIFRRPTLERELEAELADHLASETEDLIARGLSPQEARRQALRTMGHLDLLQEECRDARGITWWEHLSRDVTFAVRLLIKRKTFSAMALMTMALGIGSTSAVFSVVDTVLIKPLPYPEPHRLLSIDGLGMRGPFDVMRESSRLADYGAYESARAANFLSRRHPLPERVHLSEVSANFFQVLGVQPHLGRTFATGEDRPGRNHVALLSHQFWMQRYAGRRDVLGQPIVLDEVPYQIAGVLPPEFRFPSPQVQIWTPMLLQPTAIGQYWGQGGTISIARLRPGVTQEAARQELCSTIPRIRSLFPWRMPDAWSANATVVDLQAALVGGVRLRGWMLLGAVGLVLLIAVVNVANLMLGHASARLHEMALRISLGATAGRLARQMFTEALVLTVAGTAIGIVLGYGQLELVRRGLPANTPRLTEIAMDGRVLGLAAIASLLSGILVGLWPAWRVGRQQSLITSADLGHAGSISGRGFRVDSLLVFAQSAFATVLLVVACLLLRSFWAALQVDPGFQVAAVVTAEISPGPSAASSAARKEALWQSIRGRVLGYPGVQEAAAMSRLPLTPRISAFAAAIEDHPLTADQPQFVLWSTSVTPEHRDVLGLRLLQGRGFVPTDRAGSDPVVIISRSTARRFWEGRNPIGRRLKPVYGRTWMTIVGVVDDVKNFAITGLPSWVHGDVYLPLSQSGEPAAALSLVVRLADDPGQLEKSLPALVNEVCPTCAVANIARMESIVAQSVETPRSTAWLVSAMALLALLLAAAGVYGVVNHAVVRRTRELGLRLALGAGRHRVAALVFGNSFRSVAAGAALGLATAWGLRQVVGNLLYGISPHDLPSFLAGPLVLLLITLIAAAAPISRAVRIDPAQSLRDGAA